MSSVKFYNDIDANNNSLINAKLPRVSGNGSFVDEVRIDANGYVVTWNGTMWVVPASSGSLPTGTANSMLKYNTTTGLWENAPYLTYNGTRLRTAYNGSSTAYAEIFSATSTQIGMRLQASTTKYINMNSASSNPLVEIIGPTTTDAYSLKVGNASAAYFTVTNQGNVVANSLKLGGLLTETSGDIAVIDVNNKIARMTPATLANMLGVSNTLQFDARTVYVSSNSFNNPTTDNRNFSTFNEAITFIVAQGGTEQWNIIVYPDTYDESFTVPANVSVFCAGGVRFSDCIITLIQGARFLGYADIVNGGTAFIQVVATTLDESTITTVEGLTLAIHTVGVPLHIRCNTLTDLKATITNDYNNISPIVSKLDIKMECLDIIRIITTSVPFSQLNSYRQLPYVENNLYCQCAWKDGVPECVQAARCLMSWAELLPSNYRTAELSRITVRTNTRNPYSEFFISVGKVSVFGLEHENVIETPANYITSATYGSEDVPRTQLNIHGFRENYSSLGTAYQVANEGTLVLDSCNIRATNGGARVVYQKIYDTTYTCRTSVKNSYIEGGSRDIESATSDRLAIVASWGCVGEVGSTTMLGAWYTSVGINWI